MTKYIFVTGGVISSLGKGITAASLGRLLKSAGLRVTVQKLDPYINIDPGTMSPYQHGEVFVTEDGAETDLDLGHYERFIDVNLNKYSNTTTGQVYWEVLQNERRGDYLGSTIQVIPHITDEIKRRIFVAGQTDNADVVICEVGGTIGDIESQPFLEAIRQIKKDVGKDNVLYIHVVLLPYIAAAGELKTKPAQHSVRELRAIGIQPDILICRSEQSLTANIKRKLSMFCDVEEECIIENKTVNNLYAVPIMLQDQNLDKIVIQKLGIQRYPAELDRWRSMINKVTASDTTISIGIVGKYVALHDAYISIVEALKHAGTANGVNISIRWVNAEDIDDPDTAEDMLTGCRGVIIPGGFGERGIDGKIYTLEWTREMKIPTFGLCLGMQCMVIEFARSICELFGANSTEFNPDTDYPVIALLESQKEVASKGGTMRLGSYPCNLVKGTIAIEAYGAEQINERHRHRFEFNNNYRPQFEANGMVVSGTSPDYSLVEIIELNRDIHPWYLGCQFHPEFKSRPDNPHPLFMSFVKACS